MRKRLLDPVTGLSIGRILVGVSWLASPGLAARLFGLDRAGNPQLPYLGRMFGIREITIGAATLAASGTARRDLVIAGIVTDAADSASGALGMRNGEVGKVSGSVMTVVALGAAATGVVGLVLSRRD